MGKGSLLVDSGLIRKLSTWFIPRPANMFCRVYRSENQSIPSATWTAIEFDTERWDTGATAASGAYPSGFWAAANGTRLTATASGNYILTGHIEFLTNATGIRGIQIRTTRGISSPVIARHIQNALIADEVHGTAMSIATEYWMRPGDYAELMVYQDSGGALDLLSTTGTQAGNWSPEFTITRVP